MPKATPQIRTSNTFPNGLKVERTIWLVPVPVPPSTHPYKYSLYCGRPGERLVAYDNERGKGDHKHIMGVEYPYTWVSSKQLMADFRADVLKYCGVDLDD